MPFLNSQYHAAKLTDISVIDTTVHQKVINKQEIDGIINGSAYIINNSIKE
jgi:hypothetical protein